MRDLNYSDIDELYEKTSLEVLKKTLSNFKEDNYIPLGLNDKNDIVCYLKTTKNIHAFSKTNADLLYTDAHNSGKQPDMKTAQTFYWKVREVCRLRGLIKPVRIYKYGVFPYGGDYFFWDSNNLYLLKDKVTKIDILSVISPDLLLLKYHNKKFPDMEKLKPLSKDELKKIFEPFYLFNLDKRDRKLLVGWIIQGLVAGGLPFRAPVWIHSPSGYGKSHLTDKLIRKYFTMYARQTGRTTTPKSIPRYFDGKAMPLQRDEFEPEAFRDREAREELSYIRMSASERFPSRSISKGVMSETIEFEWCVSALYTSIEKMPALTQADKMRFIFIDLNYSFDKNYFKKITAFQKLMTTEMRYRLLLTVLLKRKDIEKAHERLRQLPQCRHIQSHIKSAYFMLAVCYNTLNPFGERIDYSKLVHSMEKIQEEKKKNELPALPPLFTIT